MDFRPMTVEQRAFFEGNGYLVIPRALDLRMVEDVTAAVDRLFERGVREHGLNRAGAYELRNCIAHDDVFLDLLDWPVTVPLVPQILNWDIQLDTSHVIVRPPQPPETPEGFKATGWHRDGGIAAHEIPEPLPLLRLKICYVLSDLSRPGRGNTRFVPGSHKLIGRPPQQPGAIDPDGAIEMLANPGDAILFEQRMFHAVGPNLSDITRKTVFMGYAYRWLKALDYVVQPPELREKVKQDPIRWQLLGFWATEMAFSLPKDEDVPLREWYREHIGDDRKPAATTAMDGLAPAAAKAPAAARAKMDS